jgi:hypothetical protein
MAVASGLRRARAAAMSMTCPIDTIMMGPSDTPLSSADAAGTRASPLGRGSASI